nr:unnamed protein product [Digitaria exilis]
MPWLKLVEPRPPALPMGEAGKDGHVFVELRTHQSCDCYSSHGLLRLLAAYLLLVDVAMARQRAPSTSVSARHSATGVVSILMQFGDGHGRPGAKLRANSKGGAMSGSTRGDMFIPIGDGGGLTKENQAGAFGPWSVRGSCFLVASSTPQNSSCRTIAEVCAGRPERHRTFLRFVSLDGWGKAQKQQSGHFVIV